MEFPGNHPLNNITRNNPYSMLESLIPFVDYPMKLPLALFVKYQELKLIINAFESREKLCGYGLHNTTNDPMEMMANVMGVSPEMLKTLMSMMETSNTNANINANTNINTNTNANTNANTNINTNNSFIQNSDCDQPQTDDHSFDDNIKNIFAEYDMLQAAEYDGESGG